MRGEGCPEAVGRDAGEVDVLYIGSRVWLGDGKELSARESGGLLISHLETHAQIHTKAIIIPARHQPMEITLLDSVGQSFDKA